MRLVEPSERFRHRGGLPTGVHTFALIMKCARQLPGLPVGVDREFGGRPLHEVAVEETDHEKPRRPVLMEQARGVPAARQALGVALEGSDLAAEMVIQWAGRLDDDSPPTGIGVENHRAHQVPAHIAADLHARQPTFQQGGLLIAESPTMPRPHSRHAIPMPRRNRRVAGRTDHDRRAIGIVLTYQTCWHTKNSRIFLIVSKKRATLEWMADVPGSTSLLRAAGLRVTRPRLVVMDAVEMNAHADTDTIFTAARRQLPDISRQTVYDILNALTAVGLARRIQPAGATARYESRVGDNHHHVVCRSCGVIADVDCAVGGAPCLTASDDLGFDIDEAEVIYWGLCPDCVKSRTT